MQVNNKSVHNKNLEINWFGALWWKRDIADQNSVPRTTFNRWWKKFDGDCVKVKAAMDLYISKQHPRIIPGDLAHLNPCNRRTEEKAKNIIYGRR